MSDSPHHDETGGVGDLSSPEVVLRSRGRADLQTSGSGVISRTVAGQRDSPASNSLSSVIESVLAHFSRDLLACDVQISLFLGSASSYRHDSCLSPFPPSFTSPAGVKDIQGLRDDLAAIPPLSILKRQLEQRNCQLSLKQLQLLLWVFSGGQSQLSLRTVPRSERMEILGKAGVKKTTTLSLPTHMLQLSNNNTDRWIERCETETTFYAFHGSRLDNWFSILNHGLQQHRSKTTLFGSGTYLSHELGMSLLYSTRGVAWEHSALGPSLSCMAIAQVINHPSVKIHSECPTRGRVEGSEGGSIPQSYILVRDNQLLNIRYILLYGSETTSPTVHASMPRNRFTTWVCSNKMAVLLLSYGLLLLLVGLSNSVWFKRIVRKYIYN